MQSLTHNMIHQFLFYPYFKIEKYQITGKITNNYLYRKDKLQLDIPV